MPMEYDILLRFLASAIVGLVIGFMRRHKAAGLRTFALICFGATVFTIVSIDPRLGAGDPSRAIAQIIAGIGFLGLGVIWKYEGRLTGLTTAAAVWVTASLGIMVGLAFWTEALAATAITMAILYSKEPLVKAKIE